jgi:trehalose utilization protein
MTQPIRITIWNEYWHETNQPNIRAVYPDGIHRAIADGIASDDFEIRTATFYDPDFGLTDEVLASTDVLFWWGHVVHKEIPDELVVLHSGHHS